MFLVVARCPFECNAMLQPMKHSTALLLCPRFFMAQVLKDELIKAAGELAAKRVSLMTLQLLQLQAAGELAAKHAELVRQLLLQLQRAPVVHQPLAGDKVFGFEQQEAELAAKLLLPGPQVLWLHGMGECLCIAAPCVVECMVRECHVIVVVPAWHSSRWAAPCVVPEQAPVSLVHISALSPCC
jgi:hypothetical protein